MDTYQPQIIWQGQAIGLLDNPTADMWYLEGYWVSNQTEAATAFEKLAKQLDLQTVYRDWDKGIEVFIQDTDGKTRTVVFSLSSENLLFVRRIYS